MTDTTNATTTSTTRRRLHGLMSKLTPERPEPRATQAVWKGVVIADSDDIVVLEGNFYFPIGAVTPHHLRSSGHHTLCPWKGTASYYDLVAGDDISRNAAWYYATPTPAASKIAGRVAFSPDVTIRPAE